MSKPEVAIVGGGVIGCSIAYHLTKEGVRSVIIERDSVASQASGKAWAVIADHAAFLAIEGATELLRGGLRPCLDLFGNGFKRFQQLVPELKEEVGIDLEYGEMPMLTVAFQESEEKFLKERVADIKRDGFEISWIGGDEVKARCPHLAPGVFGGMLIPNASQVEPYKYVLALLQAAEAKGARIKQGEVTGFRHEGSRVTAVTLAAGGEVKADVVVLAMGPWSGQGVSWLKNKLPLMINREQCLILEVPHRLPPYWLSGETAKGSVNIVSKVNGRVLLGEESFKDVVDLDSSLETEEAKMRMITAATELVPGLVNAKVVEHRGALEAWPPTGAIPTIGRLVGWDNAYIATGFGTMGILASPQAGQVITDLILTGRTSFCIGACSAARWELP